MIRGGDSGDGVRIRQRRQALPSIAVAVNSPPRPGPSPGAAALVSMRAQLRASRRTHPPRSPGENFTDPGLISDCVSLISAAIFSTVSVSSVS